MKLNLVMYCCVCAPEEFTVNGVEAERWDFGRQYDAAPDRAEPYGCGNMVFEPKPATPGILKKYKITKEEYQEISQKLKKELSFGWCGLCV